MSQPNLRTCYSSFVGFPCREGRNRFHVHPACLCFCLCRAVQLCKQTTSNPDANSDLRGWQLILSLLAVATPSKKLAGCFKKHCELGPVGSIPQTYAQYALAALSKVKHVCVRLLVYALMCVGVFSRVQCVRRDSTQRVIQANSSVYPLGTVCHAFVFFYESCTPYCLNKQFHIPAELNYSIGMYSLLCVFFMYYSLRRLTPPGTCVNALGICAQMQSKWALSSSVAI